MATGLSMVELRGLYMRGPMRGRLAAREQFIGASRALLYVRARGPACRARHLAPGAGRGRPTGSADARRGVAAAPPGPPRPAARDAAPRRRGGAPRPPIGSAPLGARPSRAAPRPAARPPTRPADRRRRGWRGLSTRTDAG